MEVATLLARAADPAVIAPDDPTSTRILDAALEAAAASGIKHLTVDEVARRAGVGRVTVYRRFGDRQGLVEALGVREARRVLAMLDESTDLDRPVADQVADAFVAGLRLLREHPLLHRLVTHEPDVLLDALTNERAALFPFARAYVASRLAADRTGGVRDDAELLEIAEAFVRITVSFALVPQTALELEDDERARDVARRLIAPLVTG
jgi:AcrR family transcriptional regulator